MQTWRYIHGFTSSVECAAVARLRVPRLGNDVRGQEFLLRTPVGRFGELEELAGSAVYLASGF